MAIRFVSFQVIPILLSSVVSPLRQVFFGLPLFRCPWGFHSRACLVMCVSFFLRVCPIHFHFLALIVWVVGCCLVLLHNSLLDILFGHLMLRMFLKHLLTKVWIDLMDAAVSLQVSDPYKSTDLTLVVNILNLVLVL